MKTSPSITESKNKVWEEKQHITKIRNFSCFILYQSSVDALNFGEEYLWFIWPWNISINWTVNNEKSSSLMSPRRAQWELKKVEKTVPQFLAYGNGSYSFPLIAKSSGIDVSA